MLRVAVIVWALVCLAMYLDGVGYKEATIVLIFATWLAIALGIVTAAATHLTMSAKLEDAGVNVPSSFWAHTRAKAIQDAYRSKFGEDSTARFAQRIGTWLPAAVLGWMAGFLTSAMFSHIWRALHAR